METKYKYYCEQCQLFTYHSLKFNSVTSSEYKFNDDYICDKCGRKHSSLNGVPIPIEEFEEILQEYIENGWNEENIVNIDGIDYNLEYEPTIINMVQMIDNSILNRNKPYISEEKIGRNDLCPCGSGKKYKKCCLDE